KGMCSVMSRRGLARGAAALAAAVTGATVVAPLASADTTTVNQTGYAVAYVSGGSLRVLECTWPNGNALGGCSLVINGPAVAPGTSPSITKVGARGYEVAYQGANHDLWIAGTLGGGDTGHAMMTTSSPAIVSPVVGGWDIAFQDTTGQLWTVGSDSRWDNAWGLPMDHASSPSIAQFGTTSFQLAYETSADTLGVVGVDGDLVEPTVALAPGTTPSIAQDPSSNGYDVAFQTNTAVMHVLSFTNGSNTITSLSGPGTGMAPGSSPTLSNGPANAGNPNGGVETGFNEWQGLLWGEGSELDGPVITPRHPSGIQIAPGSSPATIATILPAYLGGGTAPGFEMFYTDPSYNLRYVVRSAFTSNYLDPASPIGSIDQGTRPSVISFQ
ncbi:MAG TPA: hypothetical protein VFU73_12775, partial [Actinocrinis sp.]|nr:hypothetical protein [Actinocrinis sp.]